MQAFGIFLAAFLFVFSSTVSFAQQDPNRSRVLSRVKPAVVLVQVYIKAPVRFETDRGFQDWGEDKIENMYGSGFIISPNGYIVTSGHVVAFYHESNAKKLERFLIKRAIIKNLLPVEKEQRMKKFNRPLLDKEEEEIVEEIYDTYRKKFNIGIQKELRVLLSNGERYIADVKEYSPPISSRPGKIWFSQQDSDNEGETGKDVAILKIEERNLPVVKIMKGDAKALQLGEPIHAIGFPGTVTLHELLSRKTQLDATVTDGIVSGIKINSKQDPMIQTNAALAKGNSGGPAVNARGEVIGIPTLSNSEEIQGFNFLVPANTVMEFIRQAGVNLQEESLFNKLWFEALDLFAAGKFTRARDTLDEVLRVLPNQPDALQLRLKAIELQPGFPILWVVLAISLVVAAVGLALYVPQRRRKATAQAAVPALQTVVSQKTLDMPISLGTLVGQTSPYAGKTYPIGRSGIQIGRDPVKNQIMIDHVEASREHTWIGEEGGVVVVKDLNSANGTYINSTDHPCEQSTPLRDGDRVIIGKGNCAAFVYKRS